jgi:hypothetical protein
MGSHCPPVPAQSPPLPHPQMFTTGRHAWPLSLCEQSGAHVPPAQQPPLHWVLGLQLPPQVWALGSQAM